MVAEKRKDPKEWIMGNCVNNHKIYTLGLA
jgi:hypothetical protein